MRIVTPSPVAPSAAVGMARATRAADPLTWFLVEQRGPLTAHGGQYDLATVEVFHDGDGEAVLSDGWLTFPQDRGVVASVHHSTRDWVKDGVDPDAALRDAKAGVDELAASIERAVADLQRFAVTPGVLLPRDPDTFEIWLRRGSGERGRYIVPHADTPASVRDVQRAMRALSGVMWRSFDAVPE